MPACSARTTALGSVSLAEPSKATPPAKRGAHLAARRRELLGREVADLDRRACAGLRRGDAGREQAPASSQTRPVLAVLASRSGRPMSATRRRQAGRGLDDQGVERRGCRPGSGRRLQAARKRSAQGPQRPTSRQTKSSGPPKANSRRGAAAGRRPGGQRLGQLVGDEAGVAEGGAGALVAGVDQGDPRPGRLQPHGGRGADQRRRPRRRSSRCQCPLPSHRVYRILMWRHQLKGRPMAVSWAGVFPAATTQFATGPLGRPRRHPGGAARPGRRRRPRPDRHGHGGRGQLARRPTRSAPCWPLRSRRPPGACPVIAGVSELDHAARRAPWRATPSGSAPTG